MSAVRIIQSLWRGARERSRARRSARRRAGARSHLPRVASLCAPAEKESAAAQTPTVEQKGATPSAIVFDERGLEAVVPAHESRRERRCALWREANAERIFAVLRRRSVDERSVKQCLAKLFELTAATPPGSAAMRGILTVARARALSLAITAQRPANVQTISAVSAVWSLARGVGTAGATADGVVVGLHVAAHLHERVEVHALAYIHTHGTARQRTMSILAGQATSNTNNRFISSLSLVVPLVVCPILLLLVLFLRCQLLK